MTKPEAESALIIPKALARFSGTVVSVTYANAVETLEVVMPEMTRPRKSQRSAARRHQDVVDAKAETRNENDRPAAPKWSDHAPRIGEKMNCIVAQARPK